MTHETADNGLDAKGVANLLPEHLSFAEIAQTDQGEQAMFHLLPCDQIHDERDTVVAPDQSLSHRLRQTQVGEACERL